MPFLTWYCPFLSKLYSSCYRAWGYCFDTHSKLYKRCMIHHKASRRMYILYMVENISAPNNQLHYQFVNILTVSMFHWNENLFYIFVMRCYQFPHCSKQYYGLMCWWCCPCNINVVKVTTILFPSKAEGIYWDSHTFKIYYWFQNHSPPPQTEITSRTLYLWGCLFVMFWNVSEQILNTNSIRRKAKETKHFTMSTTAVSSLSSTKNPT